MRPSVGHLMKQIIDKNRRAADAALKDQRLTLAQAAALRFIAHHGGTVTQKAIEEHLEVSHPTVVGIIRRMEKSGHVVTCIDPEDRRNKLVSLTGEAAEMAKQMWQVLFEREEIMLRGLSEEDAENLIRILQIINKNVD